MAHVTLTDVQKVYAGGVEAVKGVSFDSPGRRASACWSAPRAAASPRCCA